MVDYSSFQPYQIKDLDNYISNIDTNIDKDYLLLGDSIFNRLNIESLANTTKLALDGASTITLINCLDIVKKLNPKNIIILVGTNDISSIYQYDILESTFNLYRLIEVINNFNPSINIKVLSILPINNELNSDNYKSNNLINRLNIEYKTIEREYTNVTYIDIRESFINNNELDINLTTDGLHLNAKGYELLISELNKVINLDD